MLSVICYNRPHGWSGPAAPITRPCTHACRSSHVFARPLHVQPPLGARGGWRGAANRSPRGCHRPLSIAVNGDARRASLSMLFLFSCLSGHMSIVVSGHSRPGAGSARSKGRVPRSGVGRCERTVFLPSLGYRGTLRGHTPYMPPLLAVDARTLHEAPPTTRYRQPRPRSNSPPPPSPAPQLCRRANNLMHTHTGCDSKVYSHSVDGRATDQGPQGPRSPHTRAARSCALLAHPRAAHLFMSMTLRASHSW